MKPDRFRDQPFMAAWDSTPTARSKPDCFADEIAVDFPSNGYFVERVRDGFSADGARDEGETLTTQVSLSSADALRGAVLPLDVPLRSTCHTCGGRGESWTEMCRECLGTGDHFEYHRFRLPLPPGVADGARFRFRVRTPYGPTVRLEIAVAVTPNP